MNSPHAQVTGDFVEFLGLAGLGQAEAASLTWGDVDWERGRINVRRHKTDNLVTLRNVNGTLARYKVGKHKAIGVEFVRFID